MAKRRRTVLFRRRKLPVVLKPPFPLPHTYLSVYDRIAFVHRARTRDSNRLRAAQHRVSRSGAAVHKRARTRVTYKLEELYTLLDSLDVRTWRDQTAFCMRYTLFGFLDVSRTDERRFAWLLDTVLLAHEHEQFISPEWSLNWGTAASRRALRRKREQENRKDVVSCFACCIKIYYYRVEVERNKTRKSAKKRRTNYKSVVLIYITFFFLFAWHTHKFTSYFVLVKQFLIYTFWTTWNKNK